MKINRVDWIAATLFSINDVCGFNNIYISVCVSLSFQWSVFPVFEAHTKSGEREVIMQMKYDTISLLASWALPKSGSMISDCISTHSCAFPLCFFISLFLSSLKKLWSPESDLTHQGCGINTYIIPNLLTRECVFCSQLAHTYIDHVYGMWLLVHFCWCWT